MTTNASLQCSLRLACLLLSLQAIASDDDLVNERFFESGRAIEAHWQIDCGNTRTAVTTLLATIADQQPTICDSSSVTMQPGGLGNLLDTLQKCGFIYNIRGSRRFQPCPDYAMAYRGLNSATEACGNNTGATASTLELIKKSQAALDCRQSR